MNIILVIICLICAYKIYMSIGEARYNWFFGSLLFMYSSVVVLEHPHFGAHRLFVIAFLLSLIRNNEICWESLKNNPLFKRGKWMDDIASATNVSAIDVSKMIGDYWGYPLLSDEEFENVNNKVITIKIIPINTYNIIKFFFLK